MATDIGVGKAMNAQGYGPQDTRSPEGGNNERGVLGQVWMTGVMATGGQRKSAERMKGKRDGARKGKRY
jgi:hypothetical protein